MNNAVQCHLKHLHNLSAATHSFTLLQAHRSAQGKLFRRSASRYQQQSTSETLSAFLDLVIRSLPTEVDCLVAPSTQFSHINSWLCAAGPMEHAREHFGSLDYSVPPAVNIADAVLDLVIRSPATEVDRLVAGFAAGPVAAADAEALARLTLDGAMRTAQG